MKRLFTFFALAFAWSWTGLLLANGLKTNLPLVAIGLTILAGFGPSLAAVAVVAHTSGIAGLSIWLKRSMQWRIGWCWGALALTLPAAIMGLAAGIHFMLGGSLPESPAAGHIRLTAANFVLIFFLGGPLGEEFGWRGYALPILQERWGWRWSSVLLGIIWFVWHVPLFYTQGTVQSHLPMGLYALSVIASSVLFAWVFNRSKNSIVPVLVLHTAVNGWAMIIPVMLQPDGNNWRTFQVVVAIEVLLALWLLMRYPGASNRLAISLDDPRHVGKRTDGRRGLH